MGMFDHIECKYPLPDCDFSLTNQDFQTKNMECELHQYIIDKEGYLFKKKYEEDGWKDEIIGKKTFPIQQWKFVENEPIAYTGEINFYGGPDSTQKTKYSWYEWQAEFKHGKLINLERLWSRGSHTNMDYVIHLLDSGFVYKDTLKEALFEEFGPEPDNFQILKALGLLRDKKTKALQEYLIELNRSA